MHDRGEVLGVEVLSAKEVEGFLLSCKEPFMKDKGKIAVFIDSDNALAKKIDKVLSDKEIMGLRNSATYFKQSICSK